MTAHIGPTIVIKGDVVSGEDLIVSGKVDGTLRVDGHVLSLASGSEVAAAVSAGTIVVSGTVIGTIVAEDRITLNPEASIEGELTTPKLVMSDGATLHGRVEMPKRSALKLAS